MRFESQLGASERVSRVNWFSSGRQSAFRESIGSVRGFRARLASQLVQFGASERVSRVNWFSSGRQSAFRESIGSVRGFRARFASQLVRFGASERVSRVNWLDGIFFKNGVFTAESHNSRPFGLQLLKYAARVLKKFPATHSYPEDVTSASVSVWIREQLCYLRETVLPSLRTGATRSQRNRKVSRNKLAYLWQYRRSKAIQVILNNSEYPDPPPCPSDITAIQTYYDSKCLNQRSNEDLPSPPWCLNVPPPKPTFFPKTTHFTQQEVETVLKNLPNNKASGKDGVT